jgi:hypothetical protein
MMGLEDNRYVYIPTGKRIKVKLIAHGVFENIKTGEKIWSDDIKTLPPRRHMWQIGLSIWRVGVFVFAREYAKYNTYYVVPGVVLSAVNGYDRYFDLELKVLCFGIGIRFIWIKKK